MDDPLAKYNFPPELNVKIVKQAGKQTIEFYLPVNLPLSVKDDLLKQDFRKDEPNMIISNKPKANRVYIIKGGSTGIETKIKALLFILKNVMYNGKPVFEAEYISPSKYPLSSNRFHFLNKNIPSNLTEAEIESQFGQELNLESLQKQVLTTNTNKSNYEKLPTTLSTEEVYLLVSIFNPEEIPLISGLIQDENHDSQIFHLNVPMPVSVTIKCTGFDEFQMCFADYNQVKAEQIHNQVINLGLNTIKSIECVKVTFSKADPISSDDNKGDFGKGSIAVFIPDENTAEEEFATTYVEIFLPDLNDESYVALEKAIKDVFEKYELAVCKKCKLFFCPYDKEDLCYTYFHTGKQIKFESGQMEEIAYDEEEEEPITYVNYTCCGEVPKDEPPMNCGKKENGHHEIDENEGKISQLTIERGVLPGNIHFQKA